MAAAKILRILAIILPVTVALLRKPTAAPAPYPTLEAFRLPLLQVLKACNTDGTIFVFMYDNESALSVISPLLHELSLGGKLIMTMDLTASMRTIRGNPNPEVLDNLMKRRRHSGKFARPYVFVFWAAEHVDILNPSANRSHYEWTFHDRVIIIESGTKETGYIKRLPRMKFWNYIPHAIGMRRVPERPNVIDIFTVNVISRRRGGSPSMRNINSWILNRNRFLHPVTTFFPDRFSSFNGEELKIGTSWKEPFLIWGNKLQPYMDGLDFRLMRLLQRKLNFTASLGIMGDKIGNVNSNGTWTGTLGMIVNGSIELAVGGFIMRPEMLHHFQFTRTYYTDSVTFVSPLVTKDDLWGTFARPFETLVWYSVGATGALVMATLFLLANLLWIIQKDGRRAGQWNDLWFRHPENIVITVLAQVTQRTCYRVPNSSILRCVFYATGWASYMAGIVFVTYLISSMSNYQALRSVNKVDDIITSEIRLDIRDYDDELNVRLQHEKQVLWEYARLVSWWDSSQSLKAVTSGNRIYMDSRARLEYMQRYEYNGAKVHSFHLSTENVLEGFDLTWPMRKNWPYARAVNTAMVRAVECGIVEYWMTQFKAGKFAWDKEAELIDLTLRFYLFDWDTNQKKNTRRNRDTKTKNSMFLYEPITMRDIVSLRSLFMKGCLASIICLLAEVLFYGMHNIVRMLSWLVVALWQFFGRAGHQESQKRRSPNPVARTTVDDSDSTPMTQIHRRRLPSSALRYIR